CAARWGVGLGDADSRHSRGSRASVANQSSVAVNTIMRNLMWKSARIVVALLGIWSGVASAADAPLRSEIARVNGVDVHYLIAGTGEPVVLIHGYVETSQMWRPLIAELARTH